jgi:hypothetical protein
MKPAGDRRAHARVEAVGALWGGLDIEVDARVVNSGGSGAMFESYIPADVNAVHVVTVRLGDSSGRIEARVRHCRRAPGGGWWPVYHIGVELIDVPDAFFSLG